MKISDVVLAANNTFTLPKVCTNLRKAIDDPTVEIDEIANLVSSDAMFSAKILQVANSALFRFPQQIDSIGKAISILGVEATYNLVLATAAKQMKDAFKAERLDADRYWFNSLFKGALAKELARKSRIRGADRFFVLGVLSSISELVIACHFEAEYGKYLEFADQTAPWQAQIMQFSFSFSQASSEICRQWGLPTSLYFTLSSVFTQQQTDKAVMLLQLAVKIASAIEFEREIDEISGLEPEYALWQHNTEEFYDLVDFSRKEARRLQAQF